MVTFGFYNSLNHDRLYNAEQMSGIFDGIITDGILMNVGNRFQVLATGGFGISVGSGRAWFDHTWTLNDSLLPLTVDPPDLLMDRIDALVIEVDHREEIRANQIIWVTGTPASLNPQKPTLIKGEFRNQYALAYVTIPRGVVNIPQGNIENMIGTTETPYVTAPLDHIDATQLILQWQSQWDDQLHDFHDEYLAWIDLFNSVQTTTFTLINNNWDDWSVRPGCRVVTTFLPNGNISEELRIVLNNFLLATKTTVFNLDGSILETVIFNAYTITEGGRTLVTTASTLAKTTIFNPDGSITQTIS